MRLQEIRTHKLFRLFNHVIPLNMDERITIIHGPNGYGKTAILRMIAGIFGSRFSALRSLPFERLELEFDDGNVLTVDEHIPSKEENGDGVSLEFNFSRNEPFQLARKGRFTTNQLPLHVIDDHATGLQRVGEAEWLDQETGEILDLDDVVDCFGDRIRKRIGNVFPEQERPDWFVKLRDLLDVHFIRANRLERSDWAPDGHPPWLREPTQVVARYARELAEKIQKKLAQYAELSQSLDRSFPRRLVASSMGPVLAMGEIQSKLVELEQRRRELTDAGLLGKEEQTFEDPASIDESKAAVLAVYIDDTKEKLRVFDNMLARVNLFRNILNSRFQFKTVSIDKNDGIVFSTPDGTPLAPSSLSSGEQHEVVLLYQLLFKVKANSLILIDEPELSLHIAWQERFLKDLAKITSLSNFDVLIATHSPEIISDRWDLTVELKGPNGCESTLPTTHSLTR